MESATSAIRKFNSTSTLVIVPSVYECECYDPEWRQLTYYLPDYRMLVMRTDEPLHYNALNHYILYRTDDPIITVAPEYRQLVFLGFYPESPSISLPLTLVDSSTARTPVTWADMPSGGFRMGPYVLRR